MLKGSNDTWVTVYGFNPEDQAAVLREFSKCGDILRFGSGREDRVNWIHLNMRYEHLQAFQTLTPDVPDVSYVM